MSVFNHYLSCHIPFWGENFLILIVFVQSLHNIQGLQSHMKTHLQQLIPKPPASSSGESPLPGGTLHPTTISITTSTPATAAITLGPDGDALPIDPSAGEREGMMVLPEMFCVGNYEFLNVWRADVCDTAVDQVFQHYFACSLLLLFSVLSVVF